MMLLALALVCAAPLRGLVAQQQTDVTVNVHHVTAMMAKTPNGADTYLVSVVFTLLRPDGSPIKPEGAQAIIKKESGDLPAVGVKPFGGSSSFVVVADASDPKTFPQIRTALTDLLSSNQTASTGLITFGETPVQVNPLTGINDELKKRLPNLPAQPGRACVNDALTQAIGMLKGGNLPRAIFLLTGNKDNCGKTTLDSVISQAKANQVEIYVAGLSGYAATETDLQNYAAPTGGIARLIENPNGANLRFALQNFQAVLFNQVVASWNTYPQAVGEQKGQFTVITPERQLNPVAVKYDVPQVVAAPVGVDIKQVTCANQQVRLSLGLENAPAIKTLSVIVTNGGGSDLINFGGQTPAPIVTIPAPAPVLQRGVEYLVRVAAFDGAGKELSKSAPAKCAYAEEATALVINNVDTPTLARPTFIISSTINNDAGVAGYRVWLEKDGQVVRESETIVRAGEPKVIPDRGFGAGQYVARIQALDGANGTIGAPSPPVEFTYAAPNLLDKLAFWFRQDLPLRAGGVLVLMALIGLAISASLRLMRRREPESPWLEPGLMPGKIEADPYVAVASVPASRLHLESSKAGNVTYAVERSPFTIGRGSANDAVIRVDSSVSSSHASLLFENGGWFIQDLASSNGTFVNRRKLAKNEKAPLPPGASVGLGKTVTLRFEQIGKSSEPAPVRDPRASMIEAQITAQLGALKMVSPADNPIELPITGLECSVGRATDNAITIPADGKSGVSSHHALVYSLSGRWFIRDVGSANGTFVNGKPVPSGGTLELVQGSIIGLGPKVKLEFIKND